MRKKFKKVLFPSAEIGTVVWAVRGMYITREQIMSSTPGSLLSPSGNTSPFLDIAFYFLSAILILYLLRKYAPKD